MLKSRDQVIYIRNNFDLFKYLLPEDIWRLINPFWKIEYNAR